MKQVIITTKSGAKLLLIDPQIKKNSKNSVEVIYKDLLGQSQQSFFTGNLATQIIEMMEGA